MTFGQYDGESESRIDRIEQRQREADAVRTAYPKVVGNALVLADGSTRQLRILDLLYYRLGLTSIHDLEKAYKGEPQ